MPHRVSRSGVLRRFALGLGLWSLCAAPAVAQTNAEPTSVEAVFIALGDGNFAGARAAAAAATTPAGPDLVSFVHAAELIANDRCDVARPLAERVVAASPGFLPGYDLVAECMSRAGEERRAARMFTSIAKRMPEGEDRDALLSRAAALTPALPMSADVSMEVQPSTNVNRGTDETHVGTFLIDDRSRRTSGFSVSGEVRLEKPIHAGRALFASVSLVTGAGYDTTTKQAVPILRAEATLRRLIGPESSVSVTPYVEVAFARGDLSRVQPGVRLNHDFSVGGNDVGLQLDVSHVDHQHSSSHDGLAVRASAQVTRRLGDNDKLNFTAQVSHDARRSKNASGTGIQGEIEWEHRFANGLIASAAAGVGARFHEADAPLTTDRQLDVFATGSIALSHDRLMIGKVRPEIGYRYTHGWSNDAFSRFTAHDVTLEAKARF